MRGSATQQTHRPTPTSLCYYLIPEESMSPLQDSNVSWTLIKKPQIRNFYKKSGLHFSQL